MTEEHIEKIAQALRQRCAACDARLMLYYIHGYLETMKNLEGAESCVNHLLEKIETIIGKDSKDD